MALSDIQATILSRAKSIEICDTLQEVVVATTEEDLIVAALPLAVFAYLSGIVDDTLLASFTEATLNAHGVYTTGTYTLTDPDEIFILKDAVVTVNLTGTSKCKINALGACNVTIVAADNSYCFIRCYGNTSVTITAGNNSIINIETNDNSAVTATANDDSIFQIAQYKFSTVNLIANGASYTLAFLYFNSVLTYNCSGTAVVNATAYNAAIINGPSS